MFSTIDKSLAALVMSVLSILTLVFGYRFNFLTEEWVLGIIALITPVIVYFVPNLSAKKLPTSLADLSRK